MRFSFLPGGDVQIQNYSLRTEAKAIQFADMECSILHLIPDMDVPYDTDRSSSSCDRDRIKVFFFKVVAASELKILSLEKIRKTETSSSCTSTILKAACNGLACLLLPPLTLDWLIKGQLG
jgi:hypothetical protein